MNLLHDRSAPQDQLGIGDGSLGFSSVAPGPLAGGDEQNLFRLDLLRSLQLHHRLALGVFLAGLVVAAGYLFSLWPIYTAQSVVYIQPAPPKVMDQGYMAQWPYDSSTYESFIQQQVQTMTGTQVLIGALHKLDPGSWQRKNESDQAAAERLGRVIGVMRLGTSYQVSISAHAKSAAMAAKLANAVAASYLENSVHEEKSGDTQRLAMLRDEEDRVKKELSADRDEQQELNKKLGMAGVGANTPDLYDDDLSRVRDELIKARSASDEAAAKLTSLDSNRASSAAALDVEAGQMIAGDPGLVSLKTTLNERRAVLVSQMANLTPNNPQYKQDTQEIAQIDSSIDSMMAKMRAKASVQVQQRLRADLERTGGVEARLNAQLGQMAGAAAGMTPKMQRANDLAADIIRLQTRYSTVDDRLHNLMLEDSAPGAAYLAAAALPPLHSTKSGVLRIAMAISFAGLLFGIIAAIGANKLDQKVYIAADLQHVLGFAPMAVLPDFAQVSDGVAEEHMLRLSAGIEYARQQGNLKSCIFTGTGAGAGVTTVATKVRSVLESMGRETVLVDASGTPPPPPRASSGGFGLNDASTQLATQRGSRSTALLQQLAEETETGEESLVLTDTAPLAVSAETEYLARFVDAAIIVVESGVTTRTQLREVAANLQRLDVAAVGFVLNRVGLEKADPAFRQSVRDIEQHLRSQSRSYARGTERSRPSQAARKPEQVSQDDSSEAHVEPPIAQKPAPAAQPAPRPHVPAVPELPAAPPEPVTVRPRASRMPRAEEFARTSPSPAAAVPPKQFVQRPPLVQEAYAPGPSEPAQPAIPREHESSSVRRQVPVSEPPAAPTPQSVAQTPGHIPHPAPAEDWSHVSGRLDDVKSEPVREEIQEPAETEYNAATRMSGLRNLIFSLGMKNLNQAPEPPEQVAEVAPPVEPVHERPAYPHAYTPMPQPPVRNDSFYASPTLVTAPPEFLPPKPLVETTDKERSKASAAKGRRDRRDSFDDVEILPSWRGQYKKRD
jgi:uncharacterized protein involved in exopolysaccharide biosynthesis/Mrp family chromosome partitioning ATPase